MADTQDSLSVALFSEIFMADQLVRNTLSHVLPKGMELSHFAVLNQLVRSSDEKTPAQLARSFHVTRGAMSNTLNRLDHAGYIHIRPDWDDARRKFISINGAGRHACDQALAAITPILAKSVQALGPDRVRAILPVLRELRVQFETNVPD